MTRDVINFGLRLMLVCALAAAGLSLTYGAVKSNIEKMEAEEREEGARKVLEPAGLEAEEDSDTLAALKDDYPDLERVFRGIKEDGDTGGYAFLVKSKGYNPMTLAVGIDLDGKIIGVSVVKQEETPGLGSVVAENEEYLEQYGGKGPDRIELGGGEVDAWTGATFTSTGINKGVNLALDIFEALP